MINWLNVYFWMYVQRYTGHKHKDLDWNLVLEIKQVAKPSASKLTEIPTRRRIKDIYLLLEARYFDTQGLLEEEYLVDEEKETARYTVLKDQFLLNLRAYEDFTRFMERHYPDICINVDCDVLMLGQEHNHP